MRFLNFTTFSSHSELGVKQQFSTVVDAEDCLNYQKNAAQKFSLSDLSPAQVGKDKRSQTGIKQLHFQV